MKYRRVPEEVEADQYDPDGDPIPWVAGRTNPGVWTDCGFQTIRRGEWVVRWPDDRLRIFSDTYFRANFRPAE